jgi:hypothetical protein
MQFGLNDLIQGFRVMLGQNPVESSAGALANTGQGPCTKLGPRMG